MADDNKINYDSELTPEEKQQVQEALKNLSDEDIQNDEDFIKDIYGQADNDMSKVYEENKKNKDSILDKISKVLLYYTIADNVLKLSNKEYKSLFSNFSKAIVDMFKNHSELTQNVMEDTLNNVATKVTDKYNLKKNQKQREKLVNEKYFGQHFSKRVWDNEQEVARQIQLEIKNLLLGKVSANQIAKNIKVKFDSNEYNAKRLTDTEISRIQNELFRQKCRETGAKYVLYKATFCRTCKICKSHHNITYKIDNAPLIPVHPSCHCYYTIVNNLNSNLEFMGNKITPKFEDVRIRLNGKLEKLKKVTNSKFELYTDIDSTKDNKAIGLYEKKLNKIMNQLPKEFTLPNKILVTDFDKRKFGDAIGGYDVSTDILYLNSNYDSNKKIINYLNKNPGWFASDNDTAVLLHELGHKYHYDIANKIAEKNNISYNEAKERFDNSIENYILTKDNLVDRYIENNVSGYAEDGFSKNNARNSSKRMNELMAEYFTIRNTDSDIIKFINELIREMS